MLALTAVLQCCAEVDKLFKLYERLEWLCEERIANGAEREAAQQIQDSLRYRMTRLVSRGGRREGGGRGTVPRTVRARCLMWLVRPWWGTRGRGAFLTGRGSASVLGTWLGTWCGWCAGAGG